MAARPRAPGHPPSMYSRQASVVMVNPGGSGRTEDDGHLCEIGALAAEQILHLHRSLPVLVIERERKGHGGEGGGRVVGLPAAPDSLV